jgi:hypothetical protein
VGAVKSPDKYRFSLQWGAVTEEQVLAGDYLNNLGHRKSEFVILAVTEYLSAHPDIAAAAGHKLKIVVRPNYTKEQVKAIVLAVLKDEMPNAASHVMQPISSANELAVTDSDIEEMLDNLDIFTQ